MAVFAQSEVEELVKVGCDGDQGMLVESKLFFDVGKQRVDLVRECIVNGRGDRHGEQAERFGCEAHLIQISNTITPFPPTFTSCLPSSSGKFPNSFRVSTGFRWFLGFQKPGTWKPM